MEVRICSCCDVVARDACPVAVQRVPRVRRVREGVPGEEARRIHSSGSQPEDLIDGDINRDNFRMSAYFLVSE